MGRKLQRKHKVSVATLLIALAIFVAQNQGWLSSTSQGVMTAEPGTYAIDHFVDGDTIAVKMGGKVETIRFIGIDTPETHKPNTPVQCYGPAAAAYTKSRIGSSNVRLVSDSLGTNRDRYNRLLRYVYLPDGTNLNQQIVANGYGFYYPYFPFSKSGAFKADEQAAIAAHKGLWGSCTPTSSDKGGYKMDEPASQQT